MEISDAAADLVNTCGYFGDGVSDQTQELRPQGKLLFTYLLYDFIQLDHFQPTGWPNLAFVPCKCSDDGSADGVFLPALFPKRTSPPLLTLSNCLDLWCDGRKKK